MKIYSFQVQLIHKLNEDDLDERMEFCNIIKKLVNNN